MLNACTLYRALSNHPDLFPPGWVKFGILSEATSPLPRKGHKPDRLRGAPAVGAPRAPAPPPPGYLRLTNAPGPAPPSHAPTQVGAGARTREVRGEKRRGVGRAHAGGAAHGSGGGGHLSSRGRSWCKCGVRGPPSARARPEQRPGVDDGEVGEAAPQRRSSPRPRSGRADSAPGWLGVAPRRGLVPAAPLPPGPPRARPARPGSEGRAPPRWDRL